jgi:hypothetical protein
LDIANKPSVLRWIRRAVVVLAWAGFTAFTLSEATSGTPLVWQDSLLYEKVGHAGWFSSALWTGPRAPLVPILWKLTGSPTSFVLAQTCVAIVCWSALAFVVARVVPVGWWRVVAPVAVLALATTAPVRLWDHSVLSETLALAWLALLTCLLLLLVLRPTWPRIAAAGVVALLFAATRDTGIFTVVLLAAAIGAFALRRPRHVHWRALGLSGALLAAAALPFGLESASGRGDLNVRNNYYVRVFAFPDRVSWFAGHGMPQAAQINAIAAAQKAAPGQVAVVAPDMTDPTYAQLYGWIKSDGARTYLEWLSVHPGYVLTAPFQRPPEAFNNDDGHLDFYAGSETSTAWLDRAVAGPWWYTIGATAVALTVALLGGVTRERSWQLAALLTVVGALSVFAAWHGDGQEVTRHTVEGDVQLRLGLILAFLIAIPPWWGRFGRSRHG